MKSSWVELSLWKLAAFVLLGSTVYFAPGCGGGDGRTREERAHAYMAQAMHEIGEPKFKIRDLELCHFRDQKEGEKSEDDIHTDWPDRWLKNHGPNLLTYEFVGKPYPVEFVGGSLGVGYLLKITNTGENSRERGDKYSQWDECCRFEIAGRDEWSCVAISSTQVLKIHNVSSFDSVRPVSEWERVSKVGFRRSHILYTNTESEVSDSIILRLVFMKR